MVGSTPTRFRQKLLNPLSLFDRFGGNWAQNLPPRPSAHLSAQNFGDLLRRGTLGISDRLAPLLGELGRLPPAGFHAFRHAHASLLLEAGATPAVMQPQMRHSDPRITLGIYGHAPRITFSPVNGFPR